MSCPVCALRGDGDAATPRGNREPARKGNAQRPTQRGHKSGRARRAGLFHEWLAQNGDKALTSR